MATDFKVVCAENADCDERCHRHGRMFGGLLMDVRRKVPFLWSDIRDAASLQCVASVLFLYCACMSPVITFGGLLGEATGGNIVRSVVMTMN